METGKFKNTDGETVFSALIPEYGNLKIWEAYSKELDTEYRQCLEEGKDISEYADLFRVVSYLPAGAVKERLSDIIFDIVLNARQLPGYKYNEPSDLEGIRALRSGRTETVKAAQASVFETKLAGAWYGRIAGCYLGKPVEGMKTDELHPLLKETGNFPMHRYIRASEITDEVCSRYKFGLKGRCFAGSTEYMPADDDTNYTVLACLLLEAHGRDFTPQDVALDWLRYQSVNAYCTAERVAYKNFVDGYRPPYSAYYKNPFREWIGAQIRGDFFGYINPGDPEAAAEMAWRDASISHVKNGIYGEMLFAAMLARAAVSGDIMDIIQAGLAQIPASSRLHEAAKALISGYESGVDKDTCFDDIHRSYDEHNPHDWCHTIPNALICIASLLYGGGDFGKSICMAVETGFDTDCNGATVGSVLGMAGGIDTIPREWYDCFNDTLETTIFGVGKVSITDMVRRTMKFIR